MPGFISLGAGGVSKGSCRSQRAAQFYFVLPLVSGLQVLEATVVCQSLGFCVSLRHTLAPPLSTPLCLSTLGLAVVDSCLAH